MDRENSETKDAVNTDGKDAAKTKALVDALVAKQKRLDAQDIEMGHEIVRARDPKTLDEAKQLAANWIATAAQGVRNTEYYQARAEAAEKVARMLLDGSHGFDSRDTAELYAAARALFADKFGVWVTPAPGEGATRRCRYCDSAAQACHRPCRIAGDGLHAPVDVDPGMWAKIEDQGSIWKRAEFGTLAEAKAFAEVGRKNGRAHWTYEVRAISKEAS